MNKKSILDQFAADAINAPEAVTGGGGYRKPAGSGSDDNSGGSGSGSGNKCGGGSDDNS